MHAASTNQIADTLYFNDSKQIFHTFLFNIRNYLLEVIILPTVNNFDIKQKRHGIFVLLYATNTKQDLGR